MQLTKKVEDKKPEEKQQSTLSNAQKEMYEIDYEAEIPHGKWKGKSLEWVEDNDSSYYKWIIKEDMEWKWSLIKMKDNPMGTPDKNRYFVGANGQKWLELRIIEEKTTASIWL